MEVFLDTNFVISCILKKIDFIEELEALGFKVYLAREVLQELKDLKKREGTTHAERAAIEVAFDMFEKSNIKKTTIGGKNVDEGLIAKGIRGAYVATLDAGIKNKIPNIVLISAAKNSLVIEKK
jgi:rRNA-processing protein FCF1